MEARNSGMQLKNMRGIRVRYGIKWMAEPAADSNRIMELVYKKRRTRLPLAYLMRYRFPSMTRNALIGRAKDIKIVKDGILVLSTPQRPYSEQRHDFLKSDICVLGPVSKEAEITGRFKELKKISTAEKAKAKEYIRYVTPYLDSLVTEGLVIGVLGRGSYFDMNGFPKVHPRSEDINLVLFSRDSEKRTKSMIVEVLKKIPRFAVSLIGRNERQIKAGKHPAFNFTIVSEDVAAYMKTGRYEQYVLRYGSRISLPHLTETKSDILARKLLKMLLQSHGK
jgi:hypothetical protein